MPWLKRSLVVMRILELFFNDVFLVSPRNSLNDGLVDASSETS